MRLTFRTTISATAAAAAILMSLAGAVSADDDHPPYPEIAYVHGSLGIGFAVLNSSDIQSYLDKKLGATSDITNVGVEFPFSLRVGIRNFAQFEYRLERGVGHTVYYESDTTLGTQIDMSVDSDEWLVKANPFFALYDDPSVSTFLVYGKGNVEYLDGLGGGFSDGNKTILGVEVTKMYRYWGFAVSVERHSLTFDRAVIIGEVDTGRSWDASWWIMQGSVSAGVGL